MSPHPCQGLWGEGRGHRTAQCRVKVGSADLFIGVTPFEARNILACQIAKSMGAKRTVARIDNDEYLAKRWQDYFSKIGVDVI